MTRPSLADIEQRAGGGTEGDWTADLTTGEVWADPGEPVLVARVGWAEDAAFIAAARTDLPALTAAVRDVLDPHAEALGHDTGRPLGFCRGCGQTWPCLTVRAITAHIDITPKEN